MPKGVRQHQLLYPVQVYPDFLQHLVDCMINQVPIIQTQQQQFNVLKSGEPLLSLNLQRRQLQERLQKAQQEVKFITDQIDAL